MRSHHEQDVLYRTSVDLELDLEDCRGFSVRLSLICDPLGMCNLVSLRIPCHESGMRSLICHRMEF